MLRQGPRVLLFDIDGTLVHARGGRPAMEEAFRLAIGRADVCGFSFGGMTDRAIVRKGLEHASVATDETRITEIVESYLALLERGFAHEPAERIDGALEVLDFVATHPSSAVGLGTGNVERGAFAKLRSAGLAERFAFGGYGCDHEERPRLLDVGAARGAARLGVPRTEVEVVVIGDTPLDVLAARAIGAKVIAVATGTASVSELYEVGPDLVVETLRDARVVEALG
jgi:phosphoglycolate phosphatase